MDQVRARQVRLERRAHPAGSGLAARDQQRPWLTAGGPGIVSGSVRAAIIGHSAILPVCAAPENGFVVHDSVAAKPELETSSTRARRAVTVGSSNISGLAECR